MKHPLSFKKAATLLLLLVIATRCGKNDVTGNALLATSGGDAKPVAGLEIRLLRGSPDQLMTRLRREHDEWLHEKARESVETELEARESELLEMLQQLPTGPGAEILEGSKITEASFDCSGSRQSLEKAKSSLEAAEKTFRGRRAELHAIETELRGEIEKLSDTVEAQLLSETQRMKEQYAEKHIETWQELSKNANDDDYYNQLRVRVKNSGGLNLVRAKVCFEYNGKRIPDGVAEECWSTVYRAQGFDARAANLFDLEFISRNENDEPVYGLAPGESHTYCFGWQDKLRYLSEKKQREAERLDLFTYSNLRTGTWDVRIESVSLADGKRQESKERRSSETEHRFAERPSARIFADELSRFEAGLPEREELGRVEGRLEDARSEMARLEDQWARSEERYEVERRKEELEDCAARANILRKLAAVRGKLEVFRDPNENRRGVDSLLRSAVAEEGGDSLMRVAGDERMRLGFDRYMEENAVATTRTSAAGSYRFPDVEPGEYTLFARHETSPGAVATWLLPAEVEGSVQVDLSDHNGVDADPLELVFGK